MLEARDCEGDRFVCASISLTRLSLYSLGVFFVSKHCEKKIRHYYCFGLVTMHTLHLSGEIIIR